MDAIHFYCLESFPQCITDISQVYFPSVNVRKSCKYIHFAAKSGLSRVDKLLRTCVLNRQSAIILNQICIL